VSTPADKSALTGDTDAAYTLLRGVDVSTLALYELLRLRLMRTLLVQQPAAGAQWSITCPGGTVWEVLSVKELLTTSAAAGSRRGQIAFSDGVATFLTLEANGVVGAGNNLTIEWLPGLGASQQPANINLSLAPTPPIVVPAGGTITSACLAFDAADQWSAIAVVVREWSVGQVFWAADLIVQQLEREVPTPLTDASTYHGILPSQTT
jgi:hypothetical protein